MRSSHVATFSVCCAWVSAKVTWLTFTLHDVVVSELLGFGSMHAAIRVEVAIVVNAAASKIAGGCSSGCGRR
jgi:hypothetical protein